MTQHGFAFIGTRCTGCKTCQAACKDYNDLTEEVDYRVVYEYGGGRCRIGDDGMVEDTTFAYYVPSACNHCNDAVCQKVCPTGAMMRDEQTGLVYVDSRRCIGCGYCAMACPYGCPEVDREKGRSVKCDGCVDRVKEGKKPICVEACPMRALQFGEISALRAQYGNIEAIAPMPDPSYTSPNIVFVEPAHSVAAGAIGGKVLNIKEVM